MRAGDLRTRIQIDQPVTSQEQQYGQVRTTGWTPFATVWAKVEEQGGDETEKAGQIQAIGTTKITIRYLADLTSRMRITIGARVLQIASVTNDDRKTETVVVCRGKA